MYTILISLYINGHPTRFACCIYGSYFKCPVTIYFTFKFCNTCTYSGNKVFVVVKKCLKLVYTMYKIF